MSVTEAADEEEWRARARLSRLAEAQQARRGPLDAGWGFDVGNSDPALDF